MSDLERKIRRKNKPSRKEMLKEGDAFTDAAAKGAEWAQSHARTLVYGFLGACVVIGGVWLVVMQQERTSSREGALLEYALDAVTAQVSASEADPSATPPIFADEEAKRAEAEARLRKVVDVAGTDGAGAFASVLLGAVQQTRGELKVAESTYRNLIEGLSDSHPAYFVALDRAAGLAAERGDLAGAIKLYQTLGSARDAYYYPYAQVQLAALMIKQGQADDAQTLLRSVKELDELSTTLTERADFYLAQIAQQGAE